MSTPTAAPAIQDKTTPAAVPTVQNKTTRPDKHVLESSEDPEVARKRRKLQIEKTFNDDEFNDLMINFDHCSIPAHRIIVVRKSTWFRTACTGKFKEAESKVINLFEDDPDAVLAMLLYCYDQPYTDAVDDASQDLMFHVRVYMVADKYGVDKLKELVSANFKGVLHTHWNHVNFVDAIREGYELPAAHSGVSLRPSINTVCREKLAMLMKIDSFRETLLEMPTLSFSLLDHCAGNGSDRQADRRDNRLRFCPNQGCGAIITRLYFDKHKVCISMRRIEDLYYVNCPACRCAIHYGAIDRSKTLFDAQAVTVAVSGSK